jgi:phospholipase/lecithinase/hemolysin
VLDYDFAVAGATIDNTLVPAYESTVPSYDQQVSRFLTLTNKTEWQSDNTLFTVWFGINDISRGYNASTWSEFSHNLVDRYFNISQTLYANGARNFLFMNVPPIQRTPELLAENSTAQATTAYAVSSYNHLLSEGAKRFNRHNKDVTAILFDTTPSFDEALDNPTAYGAPDATCYSGNGVSCLWWNDFHPGQAIHKLVAGAVANVTGI